MHYKYGSSPASNWFVTLYRKLFHPVSLSSKHSRQRSSLLLYSISMPATGHVLLGHYAPIICIPSPQVPGDLQRGIRCDSAGDLFMLMSLPAGNMYRVAAVAWWWSFGPQSEMVHNLTSFPVELRPGLVNDSASKMPCPEGKSADISRGFVSF